MTENDPILSFNSSRFGDLEIPAERLITSPEGIIGFPDFRRYALLDPSAGQSAFIWLHAVENPDLAFIVTDPKVFFPDYEIRTDIPDLQRLGLLEKEPPAVFVIVTVPANNPEKINANLLAPLLYFRSDNTMFQVVLEGTDWPLRAPLIELLEQEEAAGDESTGASGEVQ